MYTSLFFVYGLYDMIYDASRHIWPPPNDEVVDKSNE